MSFFSQTSPEAFAGKTLLLVGDFFIVFQNSSLVVRYYSHCSVGINAGTGPAQEAAMVGLFQRGGRHHMFGMRGYYLALPLTLWLFGPQWLLGGALLVALLLRFDYLRSIDVVREAADELAPPVSPPTGRNSPAA